MVAGEIGQTSIDYQGKDFVYGNKGALEAYVEIWHIAERAKEIYSSAGKMLSAALISLVILIASWACS
jgi:hypothetical protein